MLPLYLMVLFSIKAKIIIFWFFCKGVANRRWEASAWTIKQSNSLQSFTKWYLRKPQNCLNGPQNVIHFYIVGKLACEVPDFAKGAFQLLFCGYFPWMGGGGLLANFFLHFWVHFKPYLFLFHAKTSFLSLVGEIFLGSNRRNVHKWGGSVFMVFQGSGLVFHGSRWVFMVFQESRLVFYCSRLVFMVFLGFRLFFSRFQVGFHGFSWFQLGFS